jgi:hypothetical protein
MSLSAPSKFGVVWNNSDINRNTIPVASQIGITAGLASYTDGFPPLTMTPVASGGIPPFGQDFNGIFYAVTSALQWIQAGASYTYDSTFQTTIGGYPAGALVQRSEGLGWWLNTVANNATAPESGGAGWVPENGPGSTAITMTSSNVTLTSLQAGLGAIVITGTLTANLNLIFPTYQMQWDVINNTTGAFTITAKTAAGTGVSLVTGPNQIYGDGTNINAASSLVVTRPAGDNSTAAASTAWANNLLNGQTNIALTNANVTLTAAQAGAYILNCTGTLTGNVTVFIPASTATYQVRNATTGAYTVTFSVVGTPGSTFIVPSTAGGNTATIYSDGTNVVNGNSYASVSGRLLNIQTFTASGTYTPTPGTTSYEVEAQGPGGSSGGNVATSSSQVACSAGGGSGAYAKVRYNSVPTSQTVTIGAPGAASSAGGVGNAGGTTSFGALVSVPGGPATVAGSAVANTLTTLISATGSGTAPTITGGTVLAKSSSSIGGPGFALSGLTAGGIGASSLLGIGGASSQGVQNGLPPTGYGAGSSGCSSAPSTSATASTVAGPSIVIVREYS